jgi:hypothetical protein
MAIDIHPSSIGNSSDSLLEALTSDLKHTYGVPSTADEAAKQFWRRTYVRALFAFVEASTWLHKQYALMLHKHGRVEFTIGELALLREVQFDFQHGKVREQSRFLNVADNYRFAFYAITKVIQSGRALDVTGEPWRAFKKAIEVRNRITHPKGPTDVLVSSEEHIEIANVGIWLVAELLVLNVGLHKWMEEHSVPSEELQFTPSATAQEDEVA